MNGVLYPFVLKNVEVLAQHSLICATEYKIVLQIIEIKQKVILIQVFLFFFEHIRDENSPFTVNTSIEKKNFLKSFVTKLYHYIISFFDYIQLKVFFFLILYSFMYLYQFYFQFAGFKPILILIKCAIKTNWKTIFRIRNTIN